MSINWKFRLQLLLTLGLAALMVVLGVAPAGAARTNAARLQPDVVPDYYIVQLQPNAVSEAVAQDNGLRPDFFYTAALHGFAGYVPPGRLIALQHDARVVSVVPDQYVTISAPKKPTRTPRPTATATPAPTSGPTGTPTPMPTQPGTSSQVIPSGIRRIGGLSSPGAAIDGIDQRVAVNVAVIDTGIYSHPDLNLAGGYNCNTGTSYSDGNGHGTHVAGTIGALDNDFGVVGVAPGARLWAVRVLNNSGSGTWSSVICGINWVVANLNTTQIKVANMSLGGSGSEGTCTDGGLHQAICAAVNAGVTVVVAAGNSATDSAGSVPASYDEVITVSALADFDGQPGGNAPATCRADVDDTFADFSNFGADVDIAAPGVCILSTWNNGGYDTISGTSMASPHVAGAAALYVARFGGGPAAVRSGLLAAAETGPIPGDPDAFAEGIIGVSGF